MGQLSKEDSYYRGTDIDTRDKSVTASCLNLPMPAPDQPNFAPPQQIAFNDLEACHFLRLDCGREDDPAAQLRALERLIINRRVLPSMLYRARRTFHLDDLRQSLQMNRRQHVNGKWEIVQDDA